MDPEGVAGSTGHPNQRERATLMKIPKQAIVLDQIRETLPKASPAVVAGIWSLVSGWAPANASVVVDTFGPTDLTGGSARATTAAITARYHEGDPKVHRHATDAFDAYVATYNSPVVDEAKSRSKIGMAVGKVARDLRANGYTVGVAMANVGPKDGPAHYVVVPYTFG